MKIKILIPIYNDWQSVSKLIDEINYLSIDSKFKISVIIVNDASNHDRQNDDKNYENLESIKIINKKEMIFGESSFNFHYLSAYNTPILLDNDYKSK